MTSSKHPQPLNKSLSRNTKLFVLLAIVTIIVSYIYRDTDIALMVGSMVALLVVLLVDYFNILAVHHPTTWSAVKYVIITIVILMTLIGLIPVG